MLFVIPYFGAAALSAALAARRWLACLDGLHRLLGALVLAATFLILPVHLIAWLEIVGVVESIRLDALVGVELLLLAACSLSRLKGARVSPQAARPEGAWSFGRPPVYIATAAAGVIGAYAIGALGLFSSYPGGWDAEAYRFPQALRWFQERTLAIAPDSHWMVSLPANAEIGMFLALPTGKEQLLPWVQWLALACLGLSVYSLAGGLSKSRVGAMLCLLLTLTLPIVFYQSFSGYVDLFGTAFLAAGAALGRRWSTLYRRGVETAWGPLAVSALACGIVTGAKPTFWPFVAFYALAVGAQIFRRPGGRAWRAVALPAAILLAGLLAPSAFWFARSVRATGNPVYPLQVELGGRVFLEGVPADVITEPDWVLGRFVDASWQWFYYPWREFKNPAGLTTYDVDNGLGGVFACFVPFGLAYAFWIAVRNDQGRWSELRAWLLVWLTMFICWWFLLRQLPRFGLPLIIGSCLLASPLLSAFAATSRRTFQGLFAASVLLTSGILALKPALATASMIFFSETTRAQHYGYPPAIDELPKGGAVLNLGWHNNYAMAGKRLSNRVVLHSEAPEEVTLAFLRERGIDYVVERVDGSAIRRFRLPTQGLILQSEEEIRVGFGRERRAWRIWRVEPGAGR